MAQKPQTEKKNKPLDWKADIERARSMPDVLPYVELDIGGSTVLEIMQDEPQEIKYKDKKSGEDKQFPALKVREVETGNMKVLGISANSLRLPLAKIYDKVGTLEGQKVRIRKITYDHPEFGKDTKGYRVEHLTPDE